MALTPKHIKQTEWKTKPKPRLSMKLLWKLFTHASAPKNDVRDFLEFIESYLKDNR